LMGVSTETIQERRFEMALKLATERKVIVVLKGAGSIIASPSGNVYLCPINNPGMASAGTGDTLTGVIAGLIAQGYNPLKAAAMGVYIHAQSAKILTEIYSYEGVTASKIANHLGQAIAQVLKKQVYLP